MVENLFPDSQLRSILGRTFTVGLVYPKTVIITPHLSILERFLTRFPFFSILCIATILQSISIGLFSAVLIYYFRPSFVTSYFDRNVENIAREESESENEVENLEKLRRSVDSWSELQESD